MNVSTSSTTTATGASEISSAKSTKTSSSSKADKSFEDEMKTASKTEDTKDLQRSSHLNQTYLLHHNQLL